MTKSTVSNIDTVDHFRQMWRGNISTTQLTRKGFQGRILRADIQSCELTCGTFVGSRRSAGAFSLERPTLGIFTRADRALLSGVECRPGDISLFPAGYEHSAVYDGQVSYLLLSMPERILRSGAEDIGVNLSNRFLRDPAVLRPRAGSAATLVAEMNRLIRAASAGAVYREEPAQTIRDDALLFFARILLKAGMAEERRPSRRLANASRVVRRCEEWLHTHPMQNVRVDALAQAAGVSTRTLHRAHVQLLGTSPHRYAKLHRLSRAREALSEATPDASSVTEVAHALGFWELGRFAVDYHRLFGEVPSATLARA